MHEYITDQEFLEAQDRYNNEPDELKANEIIKTVFWPYLKNLAFCTVRKILGLRGVLKQYSTREIDTIATDVVAALVNRYIITKQHRGRYWTMNHQLYCKALPKTMVYQCAILKISEHGKGKIAYVPYVAGSYDTFEDAIIEKLSKEGY